MVSFKSLLNSQIVFQNESHDSFIRKIEKRQVKSENIAAITSCSNCLEKKMMFVCHDSFLVSLNQDYSGVSFLNSPDVFFQ